MWAVDRWELQCGPIQSHNHKCDLRGKGWMAWTFAVFVCVCVCVGLWELTGTFRLTSDLWKRKEKSREVRKGKFVTFALAMRPFSCLLPMCITVLDNSRPADNTLIELQDLPVLILAWNWWHNQKRLIFSIIISTCQGGYIFGSVCVHVVQSDKMTPQKVLSCRVVC